jgi:purine-binding chemotaxis protein CheW
MATLHAVRAEELANAFDRSFAEARGVPAGEADEFLAVQVAGERHAMRLAEVGGLHPARTVTPLPGLFPALMGLAGLRGALVPVYDLALLFGHEAPGAARWMVLAPGAGVAFAFEALDGQFRAPSAAVSSSRQDGAETGRQVVTTAGGPLPVIHIPSLVETIRRRLPPVSA